MYRERKLKTMSSLDARIVAEAKGRRATGGLASLDARLMLSPPPMEDDEDDYHQHPRSRSAVFESPAARAKLEEVRPLSPTSPPGSFS